MTRLCPRCGVNYKPDAADVCGECQGYAVVLTPEQRRIAALAEDDLRRSPIWAPTHGKARRRTRRRRRR